MILQPLVENAVRHGISVRTEGGKISVGARVDGERLTLNVVDDGPGLSSDTPDEEGRGVGLSNTRDRLVQMYGDAQTMSVVNGDRSGVTVTIDIPFATSPQLDSQS
jgi:LytS/YehU family sensor histidine kinase